MRVAPQWFRLMQASYLEVFARPHVTGKVLDIACGAMTYKRLFPDLDWTGCDIRATGDVECDARELPFPDESFDTALILDALHYIPDPQVAFMEAVRVLKPGGCLIITAQNCWPENQSMFRFAMPAFAHLCELFDLERVDLRSQGGLFRSEYEAFESQGPFAIQTPPELEGFIEHLDNTYPAMTCLIARKKEQDVGQETQPERDG